MSREADPELINSGAGPREVWMGSRTGGFRTTRADRLSRAPRAFPIGRRLHQTFYFRMALASESGRSPEAPVLCPIV